MVKAGCIEKRNRKSWNLENLGNSKDVARVLSFRHPLSLLLNNINRYA